MSDSEESESFSTQFRRSHQACRFWKGTKGSCSAGNKCNFRHERQDSSKSEGTSKKVNADESGKPNMSDKDIAGELNISIKNKTMQDSRDVDEGVQAQLKSTVQTEPSTLGEAKGKEATKPAISTQICTKWLAGTCRKGKGCAYLHEKGEKSSGAPSPEQATLLDSLNTLVSDMRNIPDTSAKVTDPSESSRGGTNSLIKGKEIDTMSTSSSSATSARACSDWKAGNCRRGVHCKFKHGILPESPVVRKLPTSTPNPKVRLPSANKAATSAQAGPTRGDGSDGVVSSPVKVFGVCWDWQNGRCRRQNCRYRHENPRISNITNASSHFSSAPAVNPVTHLANHIEQVAIRASTRQQARDDGKRRQLEEAQMREGEQEARRKSEQEEQLAERKREEDERQANERRKEIERQQEEQRRVERRRIEEKKRKEEELRRQREVREQENRRKAEEKRRREEAERLRREEERRREDERRAEAQRKAEEQRREQERVAKAAKEARYRKEAAVTQQFVVGESSLITCAAGLDIQHVVPGFDLCRIRIKNLPSNAKQNEVSDIFMQQGVSKSDFFIFDFNRPRPGQKKLEVTALAKADQGEAITIGLDGIEFREEILSFEVVDNITGFVKKNNPFLTVSWKGPKVKTETLVATYCSRANAERWANRINGKDWNGFKLKANVDEDLNDLERRFRVTITNCPPDAANDPSTHALTGTFAVRAPHPLEETAEATALGNVRDHVLRQKGAQQDTYKVTLPDGNDGETKASIHFDTWANVKRAYASVHKKRVLGRGGNLGPHLLAWHSKPLHYLGVVPNRQYTAQRRQWDALAEKKPGREAWVHVRRGDRGDVMLVRVLGEDEKAAGALKVRAEALVAGETLDATYWHPSFLTVAGRQFFDDVHEETEAHIRSDFKTHVLKIYGEPEMIEAGRSMIREEVKRKAAEEVVWTIDRGSVGFFVREGLGRLRALIGEENVTSQLVRRPTTITIKGGEEATHHLQRLIEESRTATHHAAQGTGDRDSCPVCTDEPTNPEQLGCGHTYCAGCLKHFLSSAADTKTFPLVCVGNDATCNTPLSIPFIRRFMQPQAFQHLIDVTFTYYLEQHPQELKYCTTPDCRQVYRRQQSAQTARCPSCFKTICSSCDDDVHDNMSCEETRLIRNPAEQERRNTELMNQSGYKQCPRCSLWIEKTEGCNHMTCRCGAHICWRCLAVFGTPGETYTHLNSVHGTYLDVEEPPAWAGVGPFGNIVAEQADAFAAIERQRQAAARAPARLARPAVVPPAHPLQQQGLAALLEAQAVRRRNDEERLQEVREEAARARRAEEYRAVQERYRRTRDEELRREAEARRRREEEGKSWCIVM
ncbi:hypothetical protein CPB83DRAFT_790938 [Crepidotus variabilis]|uniref:Uncharacterized protein n=1 Tax=Crepidotus variabilis TaxID=179855 RepID=A0A9P6EGA5_9AGAR|nr:hypothetical protein CPB83DRAFT_790938 [Crepidotus variabilis]